MRIFPPELEERAFRHGLLKEWRDAKLVNAEAADRIAVEIGEPPARAAWPLRVVLFGFAALCQGAAVALLLKDHHDRAEAATVALAASALSVLAAETLVKGLKVFRHGAEEALIVGAVLLAAFGATGLLPLDAGGRVFAAVFSAAAAAACALAYARYGYRLAAVGVAVALGTLVGTLDFGERGTRAALAVLYAGLLAAVSLWPGLPRRERERLEIARFFLALSVPLCLNLALGRVWTSGGSGVAMDAVGWASLAAIFLVPAGWLAWGFASRARSLIWAGGLGLIAAVCSIKPYFGWPRHSWDPAILGAELAAAAFFLERWLNSGPGRRRGAFSSESLGQAEPSGALALLAGAVAASPVDAPKGPDIPRGGGGSFGGGGASGSY